MVALPFARHLTSMATNRRLQEMVLIGPTRFAGMRKTTATHRLFAPYVGTSCTETNCASVGVPKGASEVIQRISQDKIEQLIVVRVPVKTQFVPAIIFLLDATRKICKYSIPLFFLVVEAKVNFQIAAVIVVEDDTSDLLRSSIGEPTQSQNCNTDPCCISNRYTDYFFCIPGFPCRCQEG